MGNLKKLLLLPAWGGGVLMLLSFVMFVVIQMDNPVELYNPSSSLLSQTGIPELMYAAIPAPENRIKTAVGSADARAEILRQYLTEHDSPLVGTEQLLVKVADENGFDFRWMVAIAQQESNLCKKIPADSHNCWGWGIYCLDYDEENQKCNEMKVTKFDSYEEAIVRIAPQFKDIFLTDGVHTSPDEVMGTYTPPSDGSWAYGVNQFMGDLE